MLRSPPQTFLLLRGIVNARSPPPPLSRLSSLLTDLTDDTATDTNQQLLEGHHNNKSTMVHVLAKQAWLFDPSVAEPGSLRRQTVVTGSSITEWCTAWSGD